VIVGLGMDVVDVARIRRILEGPADRAARFLARCFTAAERAYCELARDRAHRYAARFAAKEAASKALGAPAGISWHDVEVARGEGPPALVLRGVAAEAAARAGATRAHLTITHDAGVAAATVILEGSPPQPRFAEHERSGDESPPQPRFAEQERSGDESPPQPRFAEQERSGDGSAADPRAPKHDRSGGTP
jgi:holo-[acyl-carrier protein] synthase